MRDVIDLKKGQVYFRAVFFDKELSIPSIETYIYDGFDSKHGHLFMDAAGYVAKKEDVENPHAHYMSFNSETEMCILDKKHLLLWLQEHHCPQKVGVSYDYRII